MSYRGEGGLGVRFQDLGVRFFDKSYRLKVKGELEAEDHQRPKTKDSQL